MALTKVDDRGLKTPIDLLDNEQIRLGTGNDLLIYHDGADDRIASGSTNSMIIASKYLRIQNQAANETMAKFTENGAVELNYDNSKKLETTSSGVTVTGTLEATSYVAVPDQIYHVGDADTAIRFPAADTIALETAGSERMRIDSSGRVLIGDSDSDNAGTDADNLVIGAASGDNGMTIVSQSGNYNGSIKFSDGSNSGADSYRGMIQYYHGQDYMRFYTNASERMRIDSDGTVCIGTASDHGTGDVISVSGSAHIMEIQNGSTAGHRTLTLRHARASGSTLAEQIVFEENGGSAVGSIHSNGSSTSFNTSSDYRLKENVVAISDGITRLKTLKPSRFNFKVDAKTTVDGFLAHEVTAVPEAITGTKDQVATDDDIAYEKGDPIYQSIDQSKLVPLLVAALQESIAKIETLETKVAALEAA